MRPIKDLTKNWTAPLITLPAKAFGPEKLFKVVVRKGRRIFSLNNILVVTYIADNEVPDEFAAIRETLYDLEPGDSIMCVKTFEKRYSRKEGYYYEDRNN